MTLEVAMIWEALAAVPLVFLGLCSGRSAWAGGEQGGSLSGLSTLHSRCLYSMEKKKSAGGDI